MKTSPLFSQQQQQHALQHAAKTAFWIGLEFMKAKLGDLSTIVNETVNKFSLCLTADKPAPTGQMGYLSLAPRDAK